MRLWEKPVSPNQLEPGDAILRATMQGNRGFCFHPIVDIWLHSAIFIIIYTDNYIIID